MKSVRSRGSRWLLGDAAFWTQPGSCTCELTYVTACTRPAQSQVRPYPSMDRGVGHEVPSPANALWAILLHEKGSIFSKSLAPYKLATVQWKITHAGISGQHTYINRYWWEGKIHQVGCEGKWGDLGRDREAGEEDQNADGEQLFSILSVETVFLLGTLVASINPPQACQGTPVSGAFPIFATFFQLAVSGAQVFPCWCFLDALGFLWLILIEFLLS